MSPYKRDLVGLKLALFFAKAQQAEASRNAHQASQVPSVAEIKFPTPPRNSRGIDGGVGMRLSLSASYQLLRIGRLSIQLFALHAKRSIYKAI